jgi:hypothetical protein
MPSCRVAGWRASQGTIKEPDHGSTPPPISRTAGFPRSGWKSRLSVAAFLILPSLCLGERSVCCNLQGRSGSWRQPSALSALAPSPSSTLVYSQRPFARVVCYRHRHCSYGLMRQCRGHRRISRRTPLISSALRTRHLPHFDHTPMSWCHHPYAGRSPECICPSSSSGALAFARTIRTRHLHLHHSDLEHSLTGALSG